MQEGKIIILGHYILSSKVGGPVRSVTNLVENLKEKFNFVIVAPNKDFGSDKQFDNIKLYTKIAFRGIELFYCKINKLWDLKYLRLIKELDKSGNVFYLNSFFNIKQSIYIVVLKKIGILRNAQIVLCPRGELLPEILKTKRTRKYVYLAISNFLGFYMKINFHATNDFEKLSIEKCFPRYNKEIFVAGMISSSSNTQRLSVNENLIDERLKIVYLSRISRSKNLDLIVDVLMNIKKEIIIDIYGFVEDNDYLAEIIMKSNLLPKNIVFNFRGPIDKDSVPELLSRYDLFMLLSDGENYGHAIVESLKAGLPVLISDNTPWINLSELGLGWDFSLKDLRSFENCINDMCDLTTSERNNLKKDVKAKASVLFDNRKVIEENFQMFHELLNKNLI
jgi:glycosyltransferase involved in cell wall biosynthesis